MTEPGERETVLDIVARVKQVKQAKRTAKPNGKSSSSASANVGGTKSSGTAAGRQSGGKSGKTSLRGPQAAVVRKAAPTGGIKRNVSFSQKPDTVLNRREVPLGQKMRYIVDIAKSKRLPVPYDHFKSEKNVVIAGPVLEQARKHQFLIVDEESQTVQYKPKYSLRSKQQLHQMIQQNPLGLLANDLCDAYEKCEADIAELKEDGEIYQIDSTERSGSVVYPNILKAVGQLPSQEVRDALLDVEMPPDQREIDAALKAAGIRKAKRSTARLKMAVIQDNRQPVKKKRERQIRKLTNAHLADLFDGKGHGAIDG